MLNHVITGPQNNCVMDTIVLMDKTWELRQVLWLIEEYPKLNLCLLISPFPAYFNQNSSHSLNTINEQELIDVISDTSRMSCPSLLNILKFICH